MKFGIRKPNIKKSIKARTTGKAKRMVKKSVNPLYGKKGMGYINNTKKAVYNNIYNKVSINSFDMFKKSNNFIYNIFIAFPLFLIIVTIKFFYYFYKYLFIGIVWIVQKIERMLKKDKEE